MTDLLNKDVMTNKRQTVLRIIALILVSALAAMLYGCGAEAKTKAEWDKSELRWVPGTALDFELRVRPGFEYELVQGNYDRCDFKAVGGTVVSLVIQGLDYGADFENLIRFYKTSGAEKVSIGKNTQTVIAVWNSSSTETVSKLTGIYCLTAQGSDEQTIAAFFDSVIIKVNGGFFTPYDARDLYEVR